MREYVDGIFVKLKPRERELIRKKMEQAGILNMSAYIRKMAIDGYVIILDLSDLKEIIRLLRINSNNINQIAKKANETGSIYLQDVKSVQNQQEDVYKALKEIMRRLATIE